MQVRQFGAYLLDEGYVDEMALRHATHVQRVMRSRRIGEILVDMGALSPAALDGVFVAQMHTKAQVEGHRSLRFGEFLVSEGLVKESAIRSALARQWAMRQKRLGEILVELGYLGSADLERAIRGQLDLIAAA